MTVQLKPHELDPSFEPRGWPPTVNSIAGKVSAVFINI